MLVAWNYPPPLFFSFLFVYFYFFILFVKLSVYIFIFNKNVFIISSLFLLSNALVSIYSYTLYMAETPYMWLFSTLIIIFHSKCACLKASSAIYIWLHSMESNQSVISCGLPMMSKKMVSWFRFFLSLLKIRIYMVYPTV